MNGEMTSPQKAYVLGLMRKCELDLKTCTLFHTRLAEEAKIDSPRPAPGDSVDDWLSTVTKTGAAKLISVLRDKAGEQ